MKDITRFIAQNRKRLLDDAYAAYNLNESTDELVVNREHGIVTYPMIGLDIEFGWEIGNPNVVATFKLKTKDTGYILIQKDKIKLGEFDPNLIDRVMVYGDTRVIGFPPLADFELEEGDYAVLGDCDNEPFAVATAPDGTLYAYSEAPFGEDDTMIVVDNVMYAPDTMTLFEAVGPVVASERTETLFTM